MGVHTPSFANNVITKTLKTVFDRELNAKEKREIWTYFNNCCCYCNTPLDKSKREGDMDHLVSGGFNHISNRVLSCKPCNADEKLDRDWNEFLSSKCANKTIFKTRQKHIAQWTTMHDVPDSLLKHRSAVEREIKIVTRTLNEAVDRLRNLKK